MSGLMIQTTNPSYPPFAKGGKQNHDTATDLPVLTCTPLCKRGAGGDFQRGTSLIELIMFIVIVSVALAGILLVMNVTTKGSADPLIHKQAIAAAESLLEEIQLQDFIDQNDGVTTSCTAAASAVMPTNRASDYHIVDCYKGFPNSGPATGIYSVTGAAITDLASYTARVTIDSTASSLGTGADTIAAGSAVLITVTVTDPQNNDIQISGYRTKY